MKTGNKTQAIVLGVVATGAIGFLGRTLLSSFSGSQGPASRPASADRVASDKEQLAPLVSSSREPRSTSIVIPAVLKNDAFSNPLLATKKTDSSQPETPKSISKGNGESVVPIQPSESEFTLPPNVEPDVKPKQNTPDENSKTNRTHSESKEKAEVKLKVLYQGFIDAGNPVAILSVNGVSTNIELNSALGSDIKVIFISSEKVTLRFRSKSVSVAIGKEVQL
jgi:hypothetical protein